MSNANNNNIQLKISNKQRYTINGDPDRYIEINPGDAGILIRFGECIPQINKVAEDYDKLQLGDDLDNPDSIQKFAEHARSIDNQLRELVNTLFDYDVCAVCADGGSMFDLYDGEYRYAEIINTIGNLYEKTLAIEIDKLTKKMKKHTDKYTNQDHKRKGSK